MAEGLKIPSITQREFIGRDFDIAKRIARTLGYTQTAYTSTSQLWGLYCLPENPERVRGSAVACADVPRSQYPPFRGGVIIKTQELGFLFIQNTEDLGLGVIR